MPAEGRRRVLAIGIDAAEATLVRRLVLEGAMPALGALLERGRWSRVVSPAAVGSGSVWPTFFTGTPPRTHGVYSEWLWDAAGMRMRPYDPSALTPFWSRLEQEGLRVGVLDVPLAPFVGLQQGFEVSEWGAHDVIEGRTRAAPAPVSDLVEAGERHPYTGDGAVSGADGVASASLRGIGLRGGLAARLLEEVDPDLAVVVFTEIHHASHLLWHTVASDDPLFVGPGMAAGPPPPPASGPTLVELYQAVDEAIGRLVDAAGPEASVAVFALHGMRPTRGIPSRLRDLLQADGHARPATWRTRTWGERALGAFGAVKRRSPAWLRALYQRGVGHTVRVTLARPTMLNPHEWPRTRAFSLPSDQHGWVRVNLAGREGGGVVAGPEYDSLCDALERRLRGLVGSDGRPVVLDVVRTADGAVDAAGNPLPDVIVHWGPGAFEDPAHLAHLELTGQHSDEGFCVAAGPVAEAIGDEIRAESLPTALLHPLARPI